VTIRLVFETHGWSEDNERGLATGWLPGSLSPRGRQEAQQLGERQRCERVDAVFTSDLRRAVETAEIAFGHTGIPLIPDWRLRECNYGDLNGQTVDVLESQRSQHIVEPFPDGESYQQVIARVQAFLQDLAGDRTEGRVVLIGHTATRWALDHLLTGQPLQRLVAAPFDWQPGWHYTLE
jgi:broad specificity phosphatase PhoE